MSVSSITKITATSPDSFDDAIRQGLARACKTVRGITDLKVIDQTVKVKKGIAIEQYEVTLEIRFVLEG